MIELNSTGMKGPTKQDDDRRIMFDERITCNQYQYFIAMYEE